MPPEDRDRTTGERLLAVELQLQHLIQRLDNFADAMVTREHCAALHRKAPPSMLSTVSDWLKVLLMVGALIGGYFAIHDLKLTRSTPTQVTVQSAPAAAPQPLLVPYPVPSDTTTARRPRRRTRTP
jgi:hypothetical protein